MNGRSCGDGNRGRGWCYRSNWDNAVVATLALLVALQLTFTATLALLVALRLAFTATLTLLVALRLTSESK